ncbi:MAG TPA: hypothetical protein VLX91_10365 [Candidatus Acidoferrales bacterium]|nr:hypothetical protein [Candidatus Acidoferrales bacterium]
MQDMNDGSKGARGSSPPFQEPERWIEDGAGGSHWVKMALVDSEQPVDKPGESHGAESVAEPVGPSENNGGNSIPTTKQTGGK